MKYLLQALNNKSRSGRYKNNIDVDGGVMTLPLRVVIVGGGTSGYMCAAALTSVLKQNLGTVRLIESSAIGTIGVGEATLPHVRDFNTYLGIDEAQFMRECQATIKLGIEFRDWGRVGNRYIHPFGDFGTSWGGVSFRHYWLRARQLGIDVGDLEDYSYAIVAARRHRFDFPSEDAKSVRSTYSYAYHFDAGLYAAFLRRFSEARGLVHTEGMVAQTHLHPESGDIRSITLVSGEEIEGDLFIDCSGFRALLIGDALKVPWEDWTQWLPCDRAVAVACERSDDFTPYTRSTALEAGWQWRIPLQHRTGNGYVYSSAFLSEDAAIERLLGNLDGMALSDPKPLRFTTGRRSRSWSGNCVSVGLSSGFLEPLESTSIYLAQVAVTNLVRLLPGRQIEPLLVNEFNRLMQIEYDRVRDFLILHYCANSRDDSELWKYTRHMAVPDSLTLRLEQFRRRGHISKYKDGLFSPASWTSVMFGQNIEPEAYDRQAENMDVDLLRQNLQDLKQRISDSVDTLPLHADFVRDFCFVSKASGVSGVVA